MDPNLMRQGLEVAIFGLGGVFTVLILFYLSTKGLLIYAKQTAKRRDKARQSKDVHL